MKAIVITSDNYQDPVRTYFTVEELDIFMELAQSRADAIIKEANAEPDQEEAEMLRRYAQTYEDIAEKVHRILDAECGQELTPEIEAGIRSGKTNPLFRSH